MSSIRRGDRVLLTTQGVVVPAEAVSDTEDGFLQIKYKGTFSTVQLSDVRLDPSVKAWSIGIEETSVGEDFQVGRKRKYAGGDGSLVDDPADRQIYTDRDDAEADADKHCYSLFPENVMSPS